MVRGLLLLLSGSSATSSGRRSTGRGGTSTGWDGGELVGALSDQLVDVLALELGEELLELSLVRLDADGAEHLLDVSSAGVGGSTDLEEEVGSEITHFSDSSRRGVF